ncbi:MAG: thrombospondin type 3 repeat-containing protein [Verrucomicrobiota bacterium]
MNLKSFPAALVGLVFLMQPTSRAAVLINEVHIQPPDDDVTCEYVEIITTDDEGNPESQVLGNVQLLFLDSKGGKVGEVEEILDLTGLETGANGLLLIGRSFANEPVGGPFSDLVDPATRTYNYENLVVAGGRGDIGPDGGVSFILVRDFAATVGQDLDADDNGNFSNPPNNRILDSVGFGDTAFKTVLNPTFSPDNLSRIPGTLDTSPDVWVGGNIESVNADCSSVGYNEDIFGPYAGSATPGRTNAPPPSANTIRINEVLINPVGSDENFEYIELVDVNGGVASTNNLWLLVIATNADNAGTNPGEVLEAWNLSGQNTGTNGLLLLGNNYDLYTPWGNLIPNDTIRFDPGSLGSGDIGSNTGFSLLMVRGFTGTPARSSGGVATPGTDLDPDNDGTIDTRPWEGADEEDGGILDSIGFRQVDVNGDPVSPDISTYATADVSQTGANGFHPDCVARRAGQTEANDASAWYGGDMGGANNTTSVAFKKIEDEDAFLAFGDFVGYATPGSDNLSQAPELPAIVINEVHVNPLASDDSFYEFIELFSPAENGVVSLLDHHVVLVRTVGDKKGTIRDFFDLRGLSTGSNGILLLGEDSTSLVYGDQSIRPFSHIEDPQGLDGGDVGPNEGVAVLLVTGFEGELEMDIDTDDDGVFDSAPWATLVDGVGFGEGFADETIANLSGVGLRPATFSRLPWDMRTNETDAWVGGTLAGDPSDEPDSLTYDQFFGDFKSMASPGAVNVGGVSAGPVLINEVHVNPPGGDGNREFIEIVSEQPHQTTNDLTLLLLDNRGSDTGTIREAWSLDGMKTGANGLLLLGDDFTPLLPGDDDRRRRFWSYDLFPDETTGVPFTATFDQDTAVGDPDGMGEDEIANDSMNLLLVRGFTGRVFDVVDTTQDGLIDNRLWRGDFVDSIGFREYDGDEGLFKSFLYADAVVPDQRPPDNISRLRYNFDANNLSAYYWGSFAAGEVDPLQIAYGPEAERRVHVPEDGTITPGTFNFSNTNPNEDTDGDGMSNALEDLAGTDPLNSSDFLHVTSVMRESFGIIVSWSSVVGKQYVIEYSETLEPDSWSRAGGLDASEESTTSFVDTNPGRAALPRLFYRVRVDTD